MFCLGEFLRVVTHGRLFDHPHTVREASDAVVRLLDSPSATLLCPGERYWPLLAEAVTQGNATGNLVFDAQIVAVCREHGVRSLVTEDRDFDRFKGFATERI